MTGKASAVISYCLKFPVNSGRSHYLWGVFCGTRQFLKDEMKMTQLHAKSFSDSYCQNISWSNSYVSGQDARFAVVLNQIIVSPTPRILSDSNLLSVDLEALSTTHRLLRVKVVISLEIFVASVLGSIDSSHGTERPKIGFQRSPGYPKSIT